MGEKLDIDTVRRSAVATRRMLELIDRATPRTPKNLLQIELDRKLGRPGRVTPTLRAAE